MNLKDIKKTHEHISNSISYGINRPEYYGETAHEHRGDLIEKVEELYSEIESLKKELDNTSNSDV